MITGGVKQTQDNLKKVLKALDSLALDDVLVGVPEDTAGKRQDSDGGTINNAYLAAIHERGAPKSGIPARPFLIPGLIKAREQIASDMEEGAKLTLDSMNPKEAAKALNRAGQHAVNSVQEVFVNNSWTPLSEAGLLSRESRRKYLRANRKRGQKIIEDRKQGRTKKRIPRDLQANVKPLIDSGSLRKSISYILKRKK